MDGDGARGRQGPSAGGQRTTGGDDVVDEEHPFPRSPPHGRRQTHRGRWRGATQTAAGSASPSPVCAAATAGPESRQDAPDVRRSHRRHSSPSRRAATSASAPARRDRASRRGWSRHGGGGGAWRAPPPRCRPVASWHGAPPDGACRHSSPARRSHPSHDTAPGTTGSVRPLPAAHTSGSAVEDRKAPRHTLRRGGEGCGKGRPRPRTSPALRPTARPSLPDDKARSGGGKAGQPRVRTTPGPAAPATSTPV